jgi:hypothetical protein
MTLLLQENRICRAGEKAIPHKWQDYFVQRGFDDALIENMQPCLVQGRNGTTALQPGGITKRGLIYFTLFAHAHIVPSISISQATLFMWRSICQIKIGPVCKEFSFSGMPYLQPCSPNLVSGAQP